MAFMLLGVGGMGFFLASFRAAGLTESRVVFLTAASCLYDSSSGVFLAVQGVLNLFDNNYGHFRFAFLLLAVLSLTLTVALAYCWRLSGCDAVDHEVHDGVENKVMNITPSSRRSYGDNIASMASGARRSLRRRRGEIRCPHRSPTGKIRQHCA